MQEFRLAVARVATAPLVAVSAVLGGDEQERGFWPVLVLAFVVVCAELQVTRTRPNQLDPRVLLVRDALVALALTALACGPNSLTGTLALIILLLEAALTLRPWQVAIVGPLAFGASMGLAVLPGVETATTHTLIQALWIVVVMVLVSYRAEQRDVALGELHAARMRLIAETAAAEDRERARLAEALHDDTMQRIFAAGQDLEEGMLDGDKDTLLRAREGLGEALASLRALTKAMHVERLHDAGLAAALDRVVADAARRAHFEGHVEVEPDVPGDHDGVVVAFVRGLVGNVEKHALATEVRVRVGAADGAILVEVADDGRGMTLDDLARARDGGHLGHSTLRDRVEALGGTLDIYSDPGNGTTVRIALLQDRLRAQRALETQLDREREHIAALLAALQDGFVVVHNGHITDVNDRFAEMIGHAREDLAGISAASVPFWPDEEADAFLSLLADVWHTGEASGELTLVGAGGRHLEVLVSAKVAHDSKGGLVGTLVTFKDISALRRQNTVTQSLVSSYRHPIVITDERGAICNVNAAACDFTGYSSAELVGRMAPYPFVPTQAIAAFSQALRTLAADGAAVAELPLAHKSGGLVWAGVDATLLRGDHGEPVGSAIVLRDARAARRDRDRLGTAARQGATRRAKISG